MTLFIAGGGLWRFYKTCDPHDREGGGLRLRPGSGDVQRTGNSHDACHRHHFLRKFPRSGYLGTVTNRCPPPTNALYRSTRASGGVASIDVAINHPEDVAPGSLGTGSDRQGSAVRGPAVDHCAHVHTFVPP